MVKNCLVFIQSLMLLCCFHSLKKQNKIIPVNFKTLFWHVCSVHITISIIFETDSNSIWSTCKRKQNLNRFQTDLTKSHDFNSIPNEFVQGCTFMLYFNPY